MTLGALFRSSRRLFLIRRVLIIFHDLTHFVKRLSMIASVGGHIELHKLKYFCRKNTAKRGIRTPDLLWRGLAS